MLCAADIGFRYGERTVLEGVSFSLDRGEVLGVLGPNGAGKSTLARLVLGLLTPLSGSVRVDDRLLTALPIPDRARFLAAVLQSEQSAFAFTVRELVAHASAERSAVDAALRSADALALAERTIDTLSGGERQRVLLARALAQRTPYLLLDEPTAFMDLRHEQRFAGLVRSLDAGVLWILHDPDLALRFCTRVLVLARGRVAAYGPPAEVLTPALLAAVFSVQTERVQDGAGSWHLVVTGVVESG